LNKKKISIDLNTTHEDTVKNLKNVDVLIGATKKHFEKGGFVVMSKSFVDYFLKTNDDNTVELELTGFDMKLFFVLIQKSEANNRIKNFKQKELAEKLGTSVPNISISLKKLIEKKLILKIEHDYYLNDEIVYTGKKR
jgi:DNA-binding MarR family transcriptional regulator